MLNFVLMRGAFCRGVLADKPFDFENLRSPANAAPDWLDWSNDIDMCRSKVCFILRGHVWYVTCVLICMYVMYVCKCLFKHGKSSVKLKLKTKTNYNCFT